MCVCRNLKCQKRNVSIARHTHAPAQIMYATELGLPIILLVRDPVNAVVTLVIRDETITVTYALCMYIWYYTSPLSYIDKCVIANFNDVTKDFSKIIAGINIKYNKKFMPFQHNESSEKDIFKTVREWK